MTFERRHRTHIPVGANAAILFTRSSLQVNITGLDHLGLKVTDMDRSLRFYHAVRGLEVVHTSGPHENGGRSATLRLGSQKIDVFYRPDFVSADRDKPIGMDHLCLTVASDSMEDVMEYLRIHDVEVMWG